MKKRQRPLLQLADRKLRRNLLLIAGSFGALALLLIVARGAAEAMVGIEPYKLLLQFFLITAGGGVVIAIISNARDESSRRQERAASVREMQRDLDAAYRALKKTKRRLRAHCSQSIAESRPREGDASGPAAFSVPRAVFEEAMSDLLEAQIALEMICDQIGQRDDILYPFRLLRMKQPLRYASRYFHDVHEDFEKGRVRLDVDHYLLGDATNLNDYLRSSKKERDGRPPIITAQLTRMKQAKALSDRADALRAIIAASPNESVDGAPGAKGGKVRYADVAGACFDLLSDELAEARANLLS